MQIDCCKSPRVGSAGKVAGLQSLGGVSSNQMRAACVSEIYLILVNVSRTQCGLIVFPAACV